MSNKISAMRQRTEHERAKQGRVGWDIKWGMGGGRYELIVQLHQLLWGARRPALRSDIAWDVVRPGTTGALTPPDSPEFAGGILLLAASRECPRIFDDGLPTPFQTIRGTGDLARRLRYQDTGRVAPREPRRPICRPAQHASEHYMKSVCRSSAMNP